MSQAKTNKPTVLSPLTPASGSCVDWPIRSTNLTQRHSMLGADAKRTVPSTAAKQRCYNSLTWESDTLMLKCEWRFCENRNLILYTIVFFILLTEPLFTLLLLVGGWVKPNIAMSIDLTKRGLLHQIDKLTQTILSKAIANKNSQCVQAIRSLHQHQCSLMQRTQRKTAVLLKIQYMEKLI